ncbi:hypothetical protein [Rhodohalobacter halophilus]|uniref:hypothetical protein n=1 Tax=Rhodohalobacter halophilus TaxID=1812810 RepID=UPI00083FC292|nr:hypothetical protein [Rhodohalobacter halophilus]
MKYLLLLVISAVLLTNCSTTENATQQSDSVPDAPPVEEADRFHPEWYNGAVKSESDSLHFVGYAHAVDDTEAKAMELAKNSAKANLIFEVDRFAENVRVNLAEQQGQSSYAAPQYIVNLRNAVQNLDLSEADIQHEVKTKEGLQHVFIQMKISRNNISEQLSDYISESEFATL